jgi:hypothetical protein
MGLLKPISSLKKIRGNAFLVKNIPYPAPQKIKLGISREFLQVQLNFDQVFFCS